MDSGERLIVTSDAEDQLTESFVGEMSLDQILIELATNNETMINITDETEQMMKRVLGNNAIKSKLRHRNGALQRRADELRSH
jgi:hypothetical protein